MREQSAPLQPPPAAVDVPVKPRADDLEAPPPFLGSWRNVYLFVVGELAVTVVLFYALTRWAS